MWTWLLPSFAFGQVPFYQGKTITLIQARDPGDTGDLRVKATIPFLKKYIPGQPTILVEYMPGGGGRKGVNYIYRSVPPDGLTLGTVGGGLVANAALGEAGVQYDLGRLIYLGTPQSTHHWVFVTRKEATLGNLEKLRDARGIRIGAQAVGHTVYITGRLFAYLLELKQPKFVTGYTGQEIIVAMATGEIDARSNDADAVIRRSPEWIEKNLVDFHAILEVPKGNKHPRFSHLPDLENFARSDKERKLLTLLRVFRQAGGPFFLPPDTPKDRVNILQDAFRSTFRDSEFLREYKRLTGDEATPLMPEELEKAIKELPRFPEITDLFKQIAGAGPLPSR
jgi:tripartite-type tricarboxylate transporter receptor subunit TctC